MWSPTWPPCWSPRRPPSNPSACRASRSAISAPTWAKGWRKAASRRPRHSPSATAWTPTTCAPAWPTPCSRACPLRCNRPNCKPPCARCWASRSSPDSDPGGQRRGRTVFVVTLAGLHCPVDHQDQSQQGNETHQLPPATLADVVQAASRRGDGGHQDGEAENSVQAIVHDPRDHTAQHHKQHPPPVFRARCAAAETGVSGKTGLDRVNESHGFLPGCGGWKAQPGGCAVAIIDGALRGTIGVRRHLTFIKPPGPPTPYSCAP